jgi:hypothetical protein
LLETISTNGQNNQGTTTTNGFIDSSNSNLTITRSGTPTQGSITPYWPAGQWSNYFSSSYLSVVDSSSLRFGANNFTIQAWIYRTASGATHTIACKGSSTGPTGWVLQISSADKLVFIDTSTSITGSTTISINTWYYVAVVRAGTGASQTTLYVNGASDGTGTSATTFSQTDAMRIGTDRSAANGFAGYISNLRLSNTNLTISSTPTTPLLALGSTIFLSCGYNRFLDGSSLASAITVGSGTVSVQSFQPFSPSAAYTTALYGGSGYVNQQNAYLTFPLITLGSTFTVEGWFYATTITAGSNLFVSNRVQDGGSKWFGFVNSDRFRFSYGGNDRDFLTTINANTWNHVAFVVTSSTVTCYSNGTQVGSTQAAPTSLTLDTISGYGTAGVIGYLSNFRIVNGTAVYTGAFTPPTLAPLTTAGSTSAASYSSTTNINTSFAAANTSLLLNFTNAGIYDATTQNNLFTVGDAQSSTTQKQWGTTSMKYDGTGDWLTAFDGPQLQLGTGDFTIEGWVYLSAVSVAYGILSKGTATTGWSVNVTVLNKLQFSYTATNLTGTTTLATGTWYYFAVVRSGSATGNLKLYLNGSLEATSAGAVTDNFNQTNILYVGADRIGSSALNGYLQDIRITKGVGRTITASPTAAFPVQ